MTADGDVNASNVSDDVIQMLSFVGLLVIVGVNINRRLSHAVTDGAVLIRFPDIYGVVLLVARDCECSYKSTPLPVRVCVAPHNLVHEVHY